MKEKDRFLRDLGQRIAEARKCASLTQAELAQEVGGSQQVIADYERGARHIPAWRLVHVADTLGVGVEELLGNGKKVPRRRGPTPKIQKQLEAIAALPKDRRRFVEEVLESILKGSKDTEEGG